jgi:hypothetical protein
MVLPGAAMLLMAVEAVRQMAPSGRLIASYNIKEAEFLSPVTIQPESSAETVLHLRPLHKSYEKEAVWSEIDMFVYSNDRWSKFFKGTIFVQYEEKESEVDIGVEKRLRDEMISQKYTQVQRKDGHPIDPSVLYESLRRPVLSTGSPSNCCEIFGGTETQQ